MAGAMMERRNPAQAISAQIDAVVFIYYSTIFGMFRISHSMDSNSYMERKTK